jgi:type I restriction enzyme M protein
MDVYIRNEKLQQFCNTIWEVAGAPHHSIEIRSYKHYIIGLLFYKYLSDKLSIFINKFEIEHGDVDFDYSKKDDEVAEEMREYIINHIGYFILPSELFSNLKKKFIKNESLNKTIQKAFVIIENSTNGTYSRYNFKSLFDGISFDRIILGDSENQHNSNVIKIIDSMNSIYSLDYQDDSINIFGEAYDYLMDMLSSYENKQSGNSYTPKEVSELLTNISLVGRTEVNKVYDPACRNGSLLTNFTKRLGLDNIKQGFYGEEKNSTTLNLCRINMLIHNIDPNKINLVCDDTLQSPMHWEEGAFDIIVSNPPCEFHWEGNNNSLLINDPRFSLVGTLAHKSNGDLAFIMHSLYMLAPNGTASIVCFSGVLSRDGSEKKIRQYLVDNNYIDCIIQLPKKLFFGISIADCIIVLKKSKKVKNILFINASNRFVKLEKKCKLSEDNISNIIESYTNRKDEEYISLVVDNEEIAKQDYSLTVSNYIKKDNFKED